MCDSVGDIDAVVAAAVAVTDEEETVLLYYQYCEILACAEECEQQLRLCASLGLRGRVRVAPEGLNGTLAGPFSAVKQYIAAMEADVRFQGCDWKCSPCGTGGSAAAFPDGLQVRTNTQRATSLLRRFWSTRGRRPLRIAFAVLFLPQSYTVPGKARERGREQRWYTQLVRTLR
jgi:hypothetical protein